MDSEEGGFLSQRYVSDDSNYIIWRGVIESNQHKLPTYWAQEIILSFSMERCCCCTKSYKRLWNSMLYQIFRPKNSQRWMGLGVSVLGWGGPFYYDCQQQANGGLVPPLGFSACCYDTLAGAWGEDYLHIYYWHFVCALVESKMISENLNSSRSFNFLSDHIPFKNMFQNKSCWKS